MNALSPQKIGHEIECVDAAFAVLIERAKTHTERRLLIRQRNETIKELSAKITRHNGAERPVPH